MYFLSHGNLWAVGFVTVTKVKHRRARCRVIAVLFAIHPFIEKYWCRAGQGFFSPQ